MYLQTSVDSNTGRLVKMDIATGAVEVIAEDPAYDIIGRDHAPRHPRDRGRDRCTAIAWSTASSTTRFAATSKRFSSSAQANC